MLFVLIRPLSTRVTLARTETSSAQRWLMGWFGLRGIGSLYYLAYALNHGVSGAAAHDVSNLTISVVMLSIVFHGVSAQPLLSRYERVFVTSTQPKASNDEPAGAVRGPWRGQGHRIKSVIISIT